MKKILDKAKNWFINKLILGEAWDLFILGVIGLAVLVLFSIVIGYAR